MHQQSEGEEEGVGDKLERPEKERDNSQGPMRGMLYSDDVGIVWRSRNSLTKMRTAIVAEWASFGLTASQAKTETMCLMTKFMDRVPYVIDAAGQVYKQTAKFVCLGATVCENADLVCEINRRVVTANRRLRWYSLPVYDQSTAPLRLKLRIFKAEVMETMLYGCVTWSPTVTRLAILRTAHHRLPLRNIGWKKKRCEGYYMSSYADGLTNTGCENVEKTVRKRKILFAGFVLRMDNERLPKRVIFWGNGWGKWLQDQDWMGFFERDLSLFNLPTKTKHWTSAANTPGEWFRRVEQAAEQYLVHETLVPYGAGASSQTTCA